MKLFDLPALSFIGKHLFDGLSGMLAVSGAIRSFVFFFEFLDFILTDRPAGRLDYPRGIHGDTFIDGQAFGFELS